MNKYQEALNTIVDAIRDYVSYREFDSLPSENEIFGAMALLRKLVNKADSFEWIPVSERLPEPPRENPALDYKPLEVYLVSVSDEGYPIRAFWDGKNFGTGMFKLDVKAWMSLPKPYKEK